MHVVTGVWGDGSPLCFRAEVAPFLRSYALVCATACKHGVAVRVKSSSCDISVAGIYHIEHRLVVCQYVVQIRLFRWNYVQI